MSEDQFLQAVRRSLSVIETELLQVAPSLPNNEIFELMYRRFHTLAGAASLMAFPSIEQPAQDGEDLLGKMLDGEAQPSEQTLSFLRYLLKRLWHATGN